MRLRCLFGHQWSYGIGPNGDHVIRGCKRCLKITPYLAEPATDLLNRVDNIRAVQHLFDRSGWPR
jgi:hypothetical protein